MTVVSIVRHKLPLAEVQAYEGAHPEKLEDIATHISYISAFRRVHSDTEVVDIEEFASREDYDTFMSLAGDAIGRYVDGLGGVTDEQVYEIADMPGQPPA